MGAVGDSWIRRLRTAEDPRTRLVCCPPAGATAMFFLQLAQAIARPVEVVGVQYPGRRDRRHEPAVTSVTAMADELTAALADDLPTALFGHGMGAAVAFETAVRLERAGGKPLALFASGAPSPSRLGTAGFPAHDPSDLIPPTRDPAPTPLSALRDDRTAAETYRWHPADRVRCHILALAGDTDPAVTVDEATAWGELTTGRFELQVFSGGQTFLSTYVSTVANTISERITALCKGRAY
ncbi:alpha/beta fold hydrolase [Actinokineospora sp. NBRC 105648]|uniref:thioesterase II family protein n=1 Tax=Actinokineospora sp. NBRC 105648 TaxID=3032206 RepID=UPI0024A07CD0|nr:alpha/beta fold hydrolase [Actinokineospora sp. NBRC 105648]GLZ36466.1 oleoyl-ACP hydrolase [Actinokineospora sp. NBRC 105648]